jgi:hypothetical protein
VVLTELPQRAGSLLPTRCSLHLPLITGCVYRNEKSHLRVAFFAWVDLRVSEINVDTIFIAGRNGARHHI